jgi:O-antigen/teichoic acid export membrane protein
MRSGVRSLAVNAGYIFGTRALTAVLRAIYAILLARYLGPETYGLFTYGMSWYLAFLPLTFWGMNIIMSREVGRDRHGEGARIVNVSASARLLTTGLAASLCLGTGMLFEQNPEARLLIAVFTLALIGRSIATWVNDVFAAHERASFILRIEGSFRALETLLGMALLLLGFGIWAALAVHLISWWLQAVGGVMVTRRRIAAVRLLFARSGLLSLLRTGLPLAAMVFCNGWLLQGPVVLFRHLGTDAADLGQLAIASQFLVLVSQVISAVSIAALPVMSRSIDRRDSKDLLFVVWMMRPGVLFGASAAILGTVLGPWLFALLFHGAYDDAGRLLGPALWLLVPIAAAAALNQRFLAQRRDSVPLMSSASGAVAMFATAPVLIAHLGPMGAIWAAGVGRVASLALSLTVLLKQQDRGQTRDIMRLVLALCASAIAFYALRPESAPAAAALALAVLLAGNYFLVLSGAERARIASFAKSLRGAR